MSERLIPAAAGRVTESAHAKVKNLSRIVDAALEEFQMAVMFHEVWKPTAYDRDLQERMGTSYATHTFGIIGIALRREMILALMRLWDTSGGSLGMDAVSKLLSTQPIFEALVDIRTKRIGIPKARQSIADSMDEKRQEVLVLIHKYARQGPRWAVRKSLKDMRDERLAHRQMVNPTTAAIGAEDIEAFYNDSAELVCLLLSLVKATCLSLTEVADMYRVYASHFWINARGEQTEGHPRFGKVPLLQPMS